MRTAPGPALGAAAGDGAPGPGDGPEAAPEKGSLDGKRKLDGEGRKEILWEANAARPFEGP